MEPRVELSAPVLNKIMKIANTTTRDRGYTRSYYSYPAKFLAHLPRALIEMFTQEDDLIYDAYCGGGTTGLEAYLLNRRFVGYDVNPFAIFISRVKTTKIERNALESSLARVCQLTVGKKVRSDIVILDDEERQLLGRRVSDEIVGLASRILDLEEKLRDFFLLALIHSIKIVGRRDFRGLLEKHAKANAQTTLVSFQGSSKTEYAEPSFLPLFKHKAIKMIQEMESLPCARHKPEFFLASNHRTNLGSSCVDLLITSPPYKDVDVEYMQLQIQRPAMHRSKRFNIIARLLGVPQVDKETLCGFRDTKYWENLRPSLLECSRVLKADRPAFFWTGFKDPSDKHTFEEVLGWAGFEVVRTLSVVLGKDRAASSRSLHHGRDTGMLERDFLFISRKG